MGQVACPPDGDPSVVAGVAGGTESEKHHRVCQVSMSLLSAVEGEVPHPWFEK